MSEELKRQMKTTLKEIETTTIETVSELVVLWSQTFENDTCVEHTSALTDHVKLFYSEVIKESYKKREIIKTDILRLKNEASELKRLLHVNIDLTSEDHVPLFTQKCSLENFLKELRNQFETRQYQINEFLTEEEMLCHELDIETKGLEEDPFPSILDLKNFRLYLDDLNEEKNRRIDEIAQLRSEIIKNTNFLEIPFVLDEDVSLVNDPSLPLTISNIEKLNELSSSFKKQVFETKKSIDKMRNKLEILWDDLEVDPIKRKKIKKYTGYSQIVHDKLFVELARCEDEKRKNLERFVEKTRDQIRFWWQQTLCSIPQKEKQFSEINSTTYTEELLQTHEIELERLKEFYNDNQKIFDLINERQVLWDRMVVLEDKAKDPNRYANRGGNLLKEEKERNMIAKKLPNIEKELINLVNSFAKENREIFTVYGEPLEELIKTSWDDRIKKKNEEKIKSRSTKKTPLTPLQPPNLQPSISVLKRSASNLKIMPTIKKNCINSEKKVVKKKLFTEELNSNTKDTKNTLHFPIMKRLSCSANSMKKKRRKSRARMAQLKTNVPSTDEYFEFSDAIDSPCRSSLLTKSKENKNMTIKKSYKTLSKLCKLESSKYSSPLIKRSAISFQGKDKSKLN